MGGNQIYGGWVDWFADEKFLGRVSYNSDIAKGILNFETTTDSDVASDPVRVCLCTDGYPSCDITNYSIEIYGHAASLSLVTVGQRYTGVPAHIKADPLMVRRSEKEPRLHLWPDIQSLSATCTNVTYIIYHEKESIRLEPYLDVCDNDKLTITFPIYRENDSITTQATNLFHKFYVHINSNPCPLGFVLHKTDLNCICQPTLVSYGLSCDLTTTKIRREKQQWIGMTYEHYYYE